MGGVRGSPPPKKCIATRAPGRERVWPGMMRLPPPTWHAAREMQEGQGAKGESPLLLMAENGWGMVEQLALPYVLQKSFWFEFFLDSPTSLPATQALAKRAGAGTADAATAGPAATPRQRPPATAAPAAACRDGQGARVVS